MRNYKGNTLLIELMVVILFFALSQAIVLRVFARAQSLNHEAQVTNIALMRAEDTAETLAVSTNTEVALQSLGFVSQDGRYELVSPDGYRLTASISRFSQPSGELTTVELHAYRGTAELFAMPAVRYQGVNTP